MQSRAEHVWVTDSQVFGDRQAPGLLLGWEDERRADGWYGWCVVAQLGISARGDGPYVTQGWVHESRIKRPPDTPT